MFDRLIDAIVKGEDPEEMDHIFDRTFHPERHQQAGSQQTKQDK